ncbi:MAG: nicotinate (nicotinamide) nucleotide adenylyltransferase [Planctomycetes bacterium]|nr:nicotinate (nicotinamide) nucleotide adenylyltransferase [Planctomycetota bacterium]
MAKKNTILFGGTFDPIHIGHTAVAMHALQVIGAEKIIFIPAKQSPLKKISPKASDNARVEMISLAIADNNKFSVSDCELKKTQPSYTLETIKYFQETLGPDASLYWLIGADCLDELPHWYQIDELIDRCNLCVMYRAGFEKPDFEKLTDTLDQTRIGKLKQNVIETPLINISSTLVRKKLTASEDVTDMLCPAVAEYIKQHNLYR